MRGENVPFTQQCYWQAYLSRHSALWKAPKEQETVNGCRKVMVEDEILTFCILLLIYSHLYFSPFLPALPSSFSKSSQVLDSIVSFTMSQTPHTTQKRKGTFAEDVADKRHMSG